MLAIATGLTHLNWVDFAFLVIVIYSVVTGAWIGFMAECVSVAGVAAGTVVAGLTYSGAGSLLGHVGVPKDARDWAGFVAVFAIIALLFRIGALYARKLSRVMIRGWSNSVAGGLLGALDGGMLCMFIIVAVAYFQIGKVVDPLNHSQVANNAINWLLEYVTLLPQKMHHIKGFLG